MNHSQLSVCDPHPDRDKPSGPDPTLPDDPRRTHSASPFPIVQGENGVKVGITTILGNEHIRELASQEDLKLIATETALRNIIPKIKAADCDVRVLVAQTSMENCRKIAETFPFFDLLISTGSAGDPTMVPEQVRSQVAKNAIKVKQLLEEFAQD